MGIFGTVSSELTQAMRQRESGRVRALRGIRAAFLTELKRDNAEVLADEVCVTLLRRLEKQRRESIEAFQSVGRSEQAEAERAELVVIQGFLPRLVDEATTRGWLRESIEAIGASSPGDVGRVMGHLMKAHRGEVDGARAKNLAAELLSD